MRKKGKQKEPHLYTADHTSTVLHKPNSFIFHGLPRLHIDFAYQFHDLTFLNNRMNVENSLVTSRENSLQEQQNNEDSRD